MTAIPFLDLKTQYKAIRAEVSEAIQQVLDSCAFAGGPFVLQFEKEFAEFCRAGHAVGVGSGTEALWLCLLALGIAQGDEVITVPNSFIATAEAISFCGAKPVFVDVDEKTFTMKPDLIEAAITPRTRAVIPVHLFGQMADMRPIVEICSRYGLYIVEDACQAHGAEYEGRRAGSFSHAACFSFYPGKNLGAYGEAGAVVTNDAELAERLRVLRDHGQTRKYHHDAIGWNARMDGIQAAILSVKLRHIEDWNARRRQNARIYNDLLAENEDIYIPDEAPNRKHVYHVYAITTSNRDSLISSLAEDAIHCGIHYPTPIHLTAAYQHLGYGKGSFPIAEKSAGEIVSLPMFPELQESHIKQVAEAIAHHKSKTAQPFQAARL